MSHSPANNNAYLYFILLPACRVPAGDAGGPGRVTGSDCQAAGVSTGFPEEGVCTPHRRGDGTQQPPHPPAFWGGAGEGITTPGSWAQRGVLGRGGKPRGSAPVRDKTLLRSHPSAQDALRLQGKACCYLTNNFINSVLREPSQIAHFGSFMLRSIPPWQFMNFPVYPMLGDAQRSSPVPGATLLRSTKGTCSVPALPVSWHQISLGWRAAYQPLHAITSKAPLEP